MIVISQIKVNINNVELLFSPGPIELTKTEVNET